MKNNNFTQNILRHEMFGQKDKTNKQPNKQMFEIKTNQNVKHVSVDLTRFINILAKELVLRSKSYFFVIPVLCSVGPYFKLAHKHIHLFTSIKEIHE